jgi:hypothetical protein
MQGTPAVQALYLDSDTIDSPSCLGSLTWFLRDIQGRLQRWGRTSPSGDPVSSAASPLLPCVSATPGACCPPGMRPWYCTAAHSSLHALPQLHKRLVEGLESDPPQAWELQVENDIHHPRDDGREGEHVEPMVRLGASHAVASQ